MLSSPGETRQATGHLLSSGRLLRTQLATSLALVQEREGAAGRDASLATGALREASMAQGAVEEAVVQVGAVHRVLALMLVP